VIVQLHSKLLVTEILLQPATEAQGVCFCTRYHTLLAR